MRLMSVWATAMLAAKTAVIDADPRDDLERARHRRNARGMRGHQRIHPRHQKHARRHHRRRVDERADRRRAFHRVRQPDVQRHLAGFADGAAENQQRDAGRNGHAEARGLRDQPGQRGLFEAAVAAVVKEQRAGLRIEPHHAEQQREVADPRGDEGLLRRRRRAGFVIPKADQQVGGQADDLPADEQQQQAVGDDQPEHGGGKQREETEEAREVLVVRHVAEAVDEDEQANQRDHHQHDRRQRVQHPAEPERVSLICGSPNWNQKKLTTCLAAEPWPGCSSALTNATHDRASARTIEPIARDAASRRWRCLSNALSPAATAAARESARAVEQSNPSQPFIESIWSRLVVR